MKKWFIFLVLLTFGCEDVVDIELQQGPVQLVVDAELSRPVGGTEGKLVAYLSLTSDFYAEDITKATDAIVTLNTQNGSVLAEEIEPGKYSADITNLSENTSYKLEIEYDNQIYSSTEELVLSGFFESAVQGDGQLFSGDETEVIVTFTDLEGLGNYYLFDFGYNNLFVTRDRFYDGQSFSFSYFYDEFFPKNTEVNIRMIGIDEAFYNYMQILLSHSGQSGGGPFATATSSLKGNVTNLTNPDHPALGYFRVVEHSSVPFTAE
mgnify:CR=1 FL=1